MFTARIEVLSDIDNLLKERDAVVFDLNGVMWDPFSGKKYRKAEDVIKKAKELKIPVYVVSNSTIDEAAFVEKLSTLGFEKHRDYFGVLSAGMAMKSLISDKVLLREQNISTSRCKVYAVGHMFEAMLKDTEFSAANSDIDADFAYLGIPQICDDEFERLPEYIKKGYTKSYIVDGNWDVLADNKDAIEHFYQTKIAPLSLSIINANQDKVVQENTPKGSVSLARQGTFAEIAEKNGKDVLKVGKHYPYIFHLLTSMVLKNTFKTKPNIVSFGDNRTDVLGFQMFRQLSKTIDKNSTCVLCINEYWRQNMNDVAEVLKMLDNFEMDDETGKSVLGKVVGKHAVEKQAIPDFISVW